ncbi:uncharacterized protein LOC125062505 [Pieris napi]|uniref:uncharacterized protein LOC125062505 n=1 Tax=Pieris napi TaxID=78633 RepID=UPI001FB971B0|nr:uncharacterized protein LOC125062505 [Pieris napi]
MTATWSNEKITDFINEVHLYPELWDIKTGIYKDRNAKKDAWNEIAEKFGITSNEAYKKFRSLRTYANNEEKKKKSGSAGGKTVKWFAYDALSFLLKQNSANIGLDSENATSNATETTHTDINADPREFVELETTGSLDAVDTTPKPRTKRSKTTDPLLEKAQNIIRDAGEKKNEYAAFGEHVANKMSKYDDYTRSQAELKIMKILFECDMTMYRTRAGTSESLYSDLSTPPPQNPQSEDNAVSDKTQSKLNYEELVSFTIQNDA